MSNDQPSADGAVAQPEAASDFHIFETDPGLLLIALDEQVNRERLEIVEAGVSRYGPWFWSRYLYWVKVRPVRT